MILSHLVIHNRTMSEQSKKEILTRQEFDRMRAEYALLMSNDKKMISKALDLKVKAGHDYYYVHQTNWFGEPCLQLKEDLFALQECIYKSKPDYIIECGVCWGGTTLFLSTILSHIKGKGVLGIDIYMPEEVKKTIHEKCDQSINIYLKEASTIEEDTLEWVKSIVGGSSKVMVILDSHHTHDHVLEELNCIPLVKKGSYLICGDTSIERQPPAPLRPRPWGKGNNPATALCEYLRHHNRFEVDTDIENKMLMTNNQNGYLLAIK